MKRFRICVLCLCLAAVCLCPALAEEQSMPVGVIVELSDGAIVDLDNDGLPETVSFAFREADGVSEYTLTVGQAAYTGEGMYLTGRLFAVRMSEYADEAILFVSDYGMSDDPTSYAFCYRAGVLTPIATLDAMPETMTVTGSNTLVCRVRGSILYTWFRPCVYVVSQGYFESGETIYWSAASINEMPLSEYPMGAYVTVSRDIALQRSRTNGETALVIPAGAKAVIVSTDDIEWLYIEAVSPDYGTYEQRGGWLRVQNGGFEAEIGGETVQTSELFAGLLYAD